jgi:hypothetical protein
MEKSLIEISRYFGENREAVVYRNLAEENNRGSVTYEIHRYEGKKKLNTLVKPDASICVVEDIAENFVTYNDGE